jgi:hypothetical protein
MLGSPGAPAPSRGWTLIGRVKAAFLIVTVLLAMVACVGLQPIFKTIVTEQQLKVGEFARLYLDMPWIGALLGIPALICCIPLIRGTRRPLLWMSIATIFLLLPFAFLLGAFVGIMSPLYEYREL